MSMWFPLIKSFLLLKSEQELVLSPLKIKSCQINTQYSKMKIKERPENDILLLFPGSVANPITPAWVRCVKGEE